MRTMNNKLYKIRDALTSITDLKVYHYFRVVKDVPYCIWAEDGEGDSLWTSNHQSEQVITGTIDYFTRVEFDENVTNIQNALNDIENCGWQLNSIQYEDDTNLIHYEWGFQIV